MAIPESVKKKMLAAQGGKKGASASDDASESASESASASASESASASAAPPPKGAKKNPLAMWANK